MKYSVKIFAAILILALLLYNNFFLNCVFFYTKENKPVPVTLSKGKPLGSVLFLPLDSRPPCLFFVTALGSMSGWNILSPPPALLDNYYQPADYYALRQWAFTRAPSADAAIVSLDMFTYGGLIASRRGQINALEMQSALKGIEFLAGRQKELYAFAIIPRLLIAEDDATKLWQYHMMVYSTKKDMEDTFGNPADFARMQAMLSRLPPELIERFNALYEKNDAFNHKLAQTATRGIFRQLSVGQDDGQPFGRPNANMHKLAEYCRGLKNTHLTQGADEIAMLQLACLSSQKTGFSPKIKVVYSHPSVPDLVMHFMPITVEETVREKIALLNGQKTEKTEDADFVLFVHCGSSETGFLLGEIAEKAIALAGQKPLALIDLSANFNRHETILGNLLDKSFPLASLAAYAGWNTSSNSIGTALSQAALFINRKNSLDKQYWPQLYRENFEFTIARVLDDWLYQKNVQDSVNDYLRWKGIDPYRLGVEKNYALEKIRWRMYLPQRKMFYGNIGKYPFYQDSSGDYYVTALDAEVTLPWERTFEIALSVKTQVGRVEN